MIIRSETVECRHVLKYTKKLNICCDKPADLQLTAGPHGLPVALDVAKACPLSGNGITDEHFVERVILEKEKYKI